MIDFDEVDELEQERNAEDSAEANRQHEIYWANMTLELEAQAEERMQRQAHEPTEGKRGVTFVVTGPAAKDSKSRFGSKMFINDALNKGWSKIQKIPGSIFYRGWHNEDHYAGNQGVPACRLWFQYTLTLLMHLVQFHFPPEAEEHFERISVTLNDPRPGSGVIAGLEKWLEQMSKQEARGVEMQREVTFRLLRSLLTHVRRLWLCRIMVAGEIDPKEEAVRAMFGAAMASVSPWLPPPFKGRWIDQGARLPSSSDDLELEVTVRDESSGEERTVLTGKTWTIDDVKSALVEGTTVEPSEISLCDEGGKVSFDGCTVLRSFNCKFLVVSGVTFPECTESGANVHGNWSVIQAVGIFSKHNRVLKTTALSGGRCLYELRSYFTEEEFRKEYRRLREISHPGNDAQAALLDMTFSVQGKVIPQYGFDASPNGLMEMRNEQANFAGNDIWNFRGEDSIGGLDSWQWGGGDKVVWKIRRDIHSVLDMGQVLPHMSLSGKLPSWWTWAKLIAGVDNSCVEAAQWIAQSDVFLLCTGAGFSSDSGLAVYADIADIEAYADRGLTYKELCNLSWLRREPELFWGFWGQCHSDYRETAPHIGYEMLCSWVERGFRDSTVSEAIRSRLADAKLDGATACSVDPYIVEGHAGAFCAFTSNVDAHHFDWFRSCEIRECHGNTELFQCACTANRCPIVWRAPVNFKFHVNRKTMLAPANAPDDSHRDATEGGYATSPDVARIGQVRGGGRPHLLRHMKELDKQPDHKAAFGNHPSCPFCQGPARPAVLMFGDKEFLDVPSQSNRWKDWVAAVKAETEKAAKNGSALKVAILEIGAGGNVPTVRTMSELQVAHLHDAGAEVRLIRVNPELPLGDSDRLCEKGELEKLLVSIMGTGLETLHKINAAMPDHLRWSAGNS